MGSKEELFEYFMSHPKFWDKMASMMKSVASEMKSSSVGESKKSNVKRYDLKDDDDDDEEEDFYSKAIESRKNSSKQGPCFKKRVFRNAVFSPATFVKPFSEKALYKIRNNLLDGDDDEEELEDIYQDINYGNEEYNYERKLPRSFTLPPSVGSIMRCRR